MKLIEYIFYGLSVYSNPCIGPLPEIKIFFFLLSIFADEIMSSMKIITVLPNSVPGNEKLSCLLISAFIVRLTALNKQFSSVG